MTINHLEDFLTGGTQLEVVVPIEPKQSDKQIAQPRRSVIKKDDLQAFAVHVLHWLFVVANRRSISDTHKIKVAKDFNDAAKAVGLTDIDFTEYYDEWNSKT